MTPSGREPRKLVKTRLRPEIHAQVTGFAERTRRSMSAAVEELVVRGLATEQTRDDMQPRRDSVTAAEALRRADPEILARFRQMALDAGPFTDDQARIVARILGDQPDPSGADPADQPPTRKGTTP